MSRERAAEAPLARPIVLVCFALVVHARNLSGHPASTGFGRMAAAHRRILSPSSLPGNSHSPDNGIGLSHLLALAFPSSGFPIGFAAVLVVAALNAHRTVAPRAAARRPDRAPRACWHLSFQATSVLLCCVAAKSGSHLDFPRLRHGNARPTAPRETEALDFPHLCGTFHRRRVERAVP